MRSVGVSYVLLWVHIGWLADVKQLFQLAVIGKTKKPKNQKNQKPKKTNKKQPISAPSVFSSLLLVYPPSHFFLSSSLVLSVKEKGKPVTVVCADIYIGVVGEGKGEVKGNWVESKSKGERGKKEGGGIRRSTMGHLVLATCLLQMQRCSDLMIGWLFTREIRTDSRAELRPAKNKRANTPPRPKPFQHSEPYGKRKKEEKKKGEKTKPKKKEKEGSFFIIDTEGKEAVERTNERAINRSATTTT